MKTTIAAIESALAAAETAIAAYAIEKAAIRAKRDAGELSYPKADVACMQAARPAVAARCALEALGAYEIDGTPSEALMARCDVVDGWRE